MKTAPARQSLLVGAAALAVGSLIAWVDTRPNWDDSGVSAGALFLSSLAAAALGLRWWVSALLVALPLILLESATIGWGAPLVLAFAIAGSTVGAALRGPTVGPRAA